MIRIFLVSLILFTWSHSVALAEDSQQVSSSAEIDDAMMQKYSAQVKVLTKQIDESPDDINLYSQRGDAYLFIGKFPEAVADYDKMVELNPDIDTSHWRRGIAYFYAGKYQRAADQFSRYHAFDNVDRENGIWRYLSQYKSRGADAARKELLKYDKDDREPFGDVYQLFAGKITGEEILNKIQTAKISDSEREKRLFYATLYIGLNDSVLGEKDSADQYLMQANKNRWAPKAGYGPHYMWQVARVHTNLLNKIETEK